MTIDRAEAWRRADAWFGRERMPAPIGVEEFPDGFAAWRVTSESDDDTPVVVVDRISGVLTLWPRLPLDDLAHHYRNYREGKPMRGT